MRGQDAEPRYRHFFPDWQWDETYNSRLTVVSSNVVKSEVDRDRIRLVCLRKYLKVCSTTIQNSLQRYLRNEVRSYDRS